MTDPRFENQVCQAIIGKPRIVQDNPETRSAWFVEAGQKLRTIQP